MVSIRTKFHGPTNTRGARYSATVDDSGPRRSVTVECDYALSSDDNHKRAALCLVRKLGWDSASYGPWVGGSTEDGWVFVCNAGDWCRLVTR